MNRTLQIVITLLALSGCTRGTYYDFSSADRVKNGMTREQVIQIMGGPPNSVTDNKLVWSWAKVNPITLGTESRAVAFTFDKDGKTFDVPEGGVYKNIAPYAKN